MIGTLSTMGAIAVAGIAFVVVQPESAAAYVVFALLVLAALALLFNAGYWMKRPSVPGGDQGEAAEDAAEGAGRGEVDADLARQELRRVGEHQQAVADEHGGDDRRADDHPGDGRPARSRGASAAGLQRRRPRRRRRSPHEDGCLRQVAGLPAGDALGENGGPRFVAYHGRNAATTMMTPDSMPMGRPPAAGGDGLAARAHAWAIPTASTTGIQTRAQIAHTIPPAAMPRRPGRRAPRTGPGAPARPA